MRYFELIESSLEKDLKNLVKQAIIKLGIYLKKL